MNLQFAAQQARELAADRKSEPCATVLAARALIELLKRFKHDFLLVGRDTDAGVGDGERHNGTG